MRSYMPEMLSSSMIVGKGQGDKVALWRMVVSLVVHMVWLSTYRPEAQDGGPTVTFVQGYVTVDQDTKEISMAVSEEELENARQKQPATTLQPWCPR